MQGVRSSSLLGSIFFDSLPCRGSFLCFRRPGTPGPCSPPPDAIDAMGSSIEGPTVPACRGSIQVAAARCPAGGCAGSPGAALGANAVRPGPTPRCGADVLAQGAGGYELVAGGQDPLVGCQAPLGPGMHQAVLAAALMPDEQQVERAWQHSLASRGWSKPQRDWLQHIANQTTAITIVDRESLDDDPLCFKREGGGPDSGQHPGLPQSRALRSKERLNDALPQDRALSSWNLPGRPSPAAGLSGTPGATPAGVMRTGPDQR
jgi:hypothetical protein